MSIRQLSDNAVFLKLAFFYLRYARVKMSAIKTILIRTYLRYIVCYRKRRHRSDTVSPQPCERGGESIGPAEARQGAIIWMPWTPSRVCLSFTFLAPPCA